MFLPIGNEDGYLRRTPWVSFGIIAVCVGMYLWTNAQQGDADVRIHAAATELGSFAAEHPYLELPEDLSGEAVDCFQRQQAQTIAARSSLPYQTQGPETADEPDDAETLELEQEVMDGLAHALEAALLDTPMHKLGLTPASPTLLGFFTSMFTHAGLFHLLGNLWFFYILGLVLEDTYGHLVFALFYLATGLVAGIVYVLAFSHSTVPLVGASGALAGVMGAYMVRHSHDRIRMLWFLFMRWGTFLAPAWGLLALWFVEQLFMAAVTPQMEGGGIAYLAHVGGFVAGVGGAFLIHAMGWEASTAQAASAAMEVAPSARGPLSTARQLLLQGEAAGALVAAQEAARHDPHSLAVAEVLWRIHERLGAMDQAHAAALRVLRGHVRVGDGPGALAVWQAIRQSFHDPRPPAERWRLASLLTDAEARPVLAHLAGDAAAGALQAKARQRLEGMAAVAGTAGDGPGIAPSPSARPREGGADVGVTPPTEDVLAALGAPLDGATHPTTSPTTRAPAQGFGGAPPSGPADPGALVQAHRARPLQLAANALVFEDGRRLPLQRVQRVVAAVVGEAARRVVLDLVTTPPGVSPAVAVRVTSVDMDPAALLGLNEAGGVHKVHPGDAFDALLRELASRAGAQLDPADGALLSFPTVAAYERAYFAPARRNVAS